MSLDAGLRALMEPVAGEASFAELLANPSGMNRLEAFGGAGLPYSPPRVHVMEAQALGPNGLVPLRVYGPLGEDGPLRVDGPLRGKADDGGGPGLVWLHGGGFAGGDLEMREADQLARELVARTGGVVISVDYRLARGGVHFPVPHEDVIAAWFWAVEQASGLGIDPGRLCLGGASAGANLACGAAMYLKDIGSPLPAKMLLAYPFLHSTVPPVTVPSAVMSSLPPFLRFSAEDCTAMLENYLGGPASSASSYAVPGHGDPTGLPPAAVVACEYDDLRPSAEMYAQSLRGAGVEVAFRLEEGATHGYLNHSAALDIVQRGLAFLASELASADGSND
ncbi:alpha/beta hydrolase [Paenarthrobacter nicotinovorans]|uniref:Alpha/beta hydrolase n=1 Tax=Paenarthrobacter nicotinovorans TaxID=29320 RepID=A0ABV0GXL9_PAENI|nr:alpha/beta hydrolase [Paenarthrobacter nicotinovorans]